MRYNIRLIFSSFFTSLSLSIIQRTLVLCGALTVYLKDFLDKHKALIVPCSHLTASLQRQKLSSKKEVFQPHLPVRLPCYDLAPITSFALGRSFRSRTSSTPGFHGLTGGVYKARERIHRAMADARLLANPASWGRVADPSPN